MARVFVCGDTGQTRLLDAAATLLRERGHEVVRGPANEVGKVKTYTSDEIAEYLVDADVAVFTTRHRCSRELMAALPRLRGVCFPVIGVETLDVDAATDLGIIVGHGATRGNFIGMAEANIMLMLMLLYQVQNNITRMARGEWRPAVPVGHQLEGKTVGLLGFGRIARSIAERLVPFGVDILIHSPRARAEHLPPYVTNVPLERLLAESDLLSLLTGLTDETRHMIGAAQLATMKRTAFLINTGRGEICDEGALYEALCDGVIAGAALDTFAIEPLPDDSPLRTLGNVILTPHGVGHTREGADEFIPTLADNVCRILTGDLPLHTKNPEAGTAWRARLANLGPLTSLPKDIR